MGVVVGIDVAKEFHWAAALDRASGQVLVRRRVDNEPEAIASLVAELEALGAERLVVGLDLVGGIAGLVTAMFQAAGIELVHVPGLAVARARQATSGGENKSDPKDAQVIADQVRMRSDLRPIPAPEGEVDAELRLLAGRRRDLSTDQTRRLNRLRGLLCSIHPGLERKIVTNKLGLWMLARYVTPAEIRRAGENRLRAHLLRASNLRRAQIEELIVAALASARAQRVAVPGERVAADLVRELAREALAARERLAELDAELSAALERHPDGALILSLPGMGAVLTAEFIAEAGGIGRFPSSDQLAAASGLAPVLRQSGKVRYLQRARGGSRHLRRVFYQSALSSLSHPASRRFYERKRSEGKSHHQALIALARRRVDVLHAMLRTRQPYLMRPARAA